MNNIAGHLVNAQEFLQERAIKNFTQVCPEYGAGVRNALNRIKASQTSNSTDIRAVTASNAKLWVDQFQQSNSSTSQAVVCLVKFSSFDTEVYRIFLQ